MTVQFNTDNNIDGDERKEDYFTSLLKDEMERYESYLTRIEVHLSDGKAKREGQKDIKCILEARMQGRQPLAVTAQAGTVEEAVSDAIDKLHNALRSIVGRIQDHHKSI